VAGIVTPSSSNISLVCCTLQLTQTCSILAKPTQPYLSCKIVCMRCRGGSPSEEEVQQKKEKLASILKQHDVTVKDTTSTHLWQYYPPFAPNWLRLQEVLLPIEAENGVTDGDDLSAEHSTHAKATSSSS